MDGLQLAAQREAEYQAPIGLPRVQDCINKIRSQLDVIADHDIRSRLKNIATTTIRITLRLLPRDGTYTSQNRHILDGTAKALLISLVSQVEDLLFTTDVQFRQTSEPLEKTITLVRDAIAGYAIMLGDWRDTIDGLSLPVSGHTKTVRLLAILFDLAVYHPSRQILDESPNHHLSSLIATMNDISHWLNHAAMLSRLSDKNRRYIFQTMTSYTTHRERTLVLELPSWSSSSDSFTSIVASTYPASSTVTPPNGAEAYPSPVDTPMPSTARSLSFSGSVLVHDAIKEPRCSLYVDSVHECETEGCSSSSGAPLSEASIVMSSPGITDSMIDNAILMESSSSDESNDDAIMNNLVCSSDDHDAVAEDEPVDDTDALMMQQQQQQHQRLSSLHERRQSVAATAASEIEMERSADVRHERMKSLQRLSGNESPESDRRLLRVWSLPTDSLLGSAPARRRRVTEGEEASPLSAGRRVLPVALGTSRSCPSPGTRGM